MTLLAILFLLLGGTAAVAADPPARVGRLSLVEGTVSLRAADAEDWSPATLNHPVSTGHSLWTEAGARAEIQVGDLEIRLNETTEIGVARLDDAGTELSLHQGFANIHVRTLPTGGVRIDTPRGPVRLLRPGRYHVEILGNEGSVDDVEVAVFEGEAQVPGRQPLRAGMGVMLAGDPPETRLIQTRGTSFDDWSDARARATLAPQARTYVSPQMTGHQDLDRHGTWRHAPEYGAVWYPTVVVDDWAPYRYGHWAYVHPWGWTWIDDAPWGFAPFHYGRWVKIGHRWAWWPGTYVARPVYAPALVAFVGGDGWSVSIALGSRPAIGWVPLAPHELYRPHYRTSVTYIRNVNITTVNKTVIKNIHVRNRATEVTRFVNRGAATVVESDSFRRGRKTQDAKIEVAHRDLERAPTSSEARRLKPERVAMRSEIARPTPRRGAIEPRPASPSARQATANAPATDAPKPQAKPARAESAREVGVARTQPPRPRAEGPRPEARPTAEAPATRSPPVARVEPRSKPQIPPRTGRPAATTRGERPEPPARFEPPRSKPRIDTRPGPPPEPNLEARPEPRNARSQRVDQARGGNRKPRPQDEPKG